MIATINALLFPGLVLVYLGLATIVLYRSPSYGWGFPLFVLAYLVFIVAGFFIDTRELLITWLLFAIGNMFVQRWFMKRQGLSTSPAVTLSSLLLWPIQFAAVIHNLSADAIAEVSKTESRERLGALPTTVTGVVSYTHHIDVDKGYDAVWLEEFDELEFIVEAARYDQLRIAEGKRITVTVDERDAPADLADGKVLWIVDDSRAEAAQGSDS